jgi:uncharacterized protein
VTDASAGSVDVPATPAAEQSEAPSESESESGPAGSEGSGQAAGAGSEGSSQPSAGDSSTEPNGAAEASVSEPPAESTLFDPVGEPTDEPLAGPTVPPPVAGDFRMALVSNISVDLPNQHPSVVLRESESPRRQLTFSIAFHDAVILSHALRRIPTPRPLTHELLSGILQRFDIDVVAVRLVGRQGSVYFAELDLMGRNGRSVHSCRPTDALTVALQQPVPVPILIDRRLFEQAGDVAPLG